MESTSVSADYDRLTAQYEQERHDLAAEQLAAWDKRPLRVIVSALLSGVWLSLGGQTVLPIGLLISMMLLVPTVSGWSLWRRVRRTGHRALLLAGCALLGLFLVQLRVGLFDPTGNLVTASFEFGLNLPW